MITVADYGAGNIRSVLKALSYIGCEAQLSSDPARLLDSEGVILPGVGAYGDAMRALEKNHLADTVRKYIASGRPFLGICLGQQVLFDSSEESPGVAGLGVFRGTVRRLPADCGLKVPHIGWNSLTLNSMCPLFDGVGEHPYVYFVHSYYLEAEDSGIVSATADYGATIHAAVWKENCFATQFHPEKSGDIGLRILRNFVSMTTR